MADDRLYVGNTRTMDYVCVSKCFAYDWGKVDGSKIDLILSLGVFSVKDIEFFFESDDRYENYVKEGFLIKK